MDSMLLTLAMIFSPPAQATQATVTPVTVYQCTNGPQYVTVIQLGDLFTYRSGASNLPAQPDVILVRARHELRWQVSEAPGAFMALNFVDSGMTYRVMSRRHDNEMRHYVDTYQGKQRVGHVRCMPGTFVDHLKTTVGDIPGEV